jgi:beta-glucuronidase
LFVRLSLLLSFLATAAITSQAQNSAQPPAQTSAPDFSALVQNALHRKVTSLNGDWHYIVDPYDGGTRRRYYLNLKGSEQPGVVEYDFGNAPTLRVPGDWNTQKPELLFYEGMFWYERSFTYHPSPGTHTFIYVGAANYRAHIWINGESVCEHEGGFTSFDCDAKRVLKEGDNFVVISVNNVRKPDNVPALTPDWWDYGGLTRDVMLVEVPQVFVQDYSLQLERGTSNRITGWVRVAATAAPWASQPAAPIQTTGGKPTPQKIAVRIPELKISQTASIGEDGVARFAFDAPGLQLWSPESPKLYAVEITSDSDHVNDDIGFRSIEVRGTEILLNGRPMFLRGISMHEDSVTHPGRAHGDDDATALLALAKDLRCNFVRLAHYPYDEHMTRMADRMGILVWSEVPVYQSINWSDPAVLQKAKQQLTEMITRDRNRSSIIMWSVTNESRAIPERNAFVHELVTLARSLDPTRLITAATNQFNRPDARSLIVNDPLIADLDVYGINEYVGWYWSTIEDLDSYTFNAPSNKPMIVSEFGAEAKFGLHGAPTQRWTEEYQEEVYKHQIPALQKIPFLRGMSPWVLKDFRSPVRQLPGIQDGFNRKGLVSDDGKRKKAFYVLQQFYSQKAAQAPR